MRLLRGRVAGNSAGVSVWRTTMKGVVCVAAILAVLSSPAMALDLNGSLSKNKAVVDGGSTSSSGVIGGSAFGGRTGIVSGNSSSALGGVQATNGHQQSTVTQNYSTSSTSVLHSSSIGGAGSAGIAGGDAQMIGSGAAKQVSVGAKVKLW
jgi:hypothetical protein